MNYRCLLSLLFVALSLSVWAEQIPESTARQVAQHVLSGFNPLRATVSPVLAYQAPNSLRAGGGADYYIYTPDQGTGFVIVAGDDLAYPVLGYSTSDPFSADHIPTPMLEWLQNYQKELAGAKSPTAPESVARQWASVLRGDLRLGTGRVLDTPKWDQGDPYNRMTPMVNGEHTVVGCVATAMGIIMAYHQYPERVINGPATNKIHVEGKPKTVRVDYQEPYDWANILSSYQNGSYDGTQAMAVARLLYHCGVNVEMGYGIQASAAPSTLVPIALRNIFAYSPTIQYARKEQMTWEAWKTMIRDDIDEGLPIYYDGYGEQEGHAFVCDGYYENYFHFNWGWGSYCDGYYLLSALVPGGTDFSADQSAVFHIRPTTAGEKPEPVFIVMRANYSRDGNLVQGSYWVSYTGMDPITYSLGVGVIDSQDRVIQEPVESRISSMLFNELTGIETEFKFYLDRSLSADEKVVILGSKDDQNWEVLPTSPNAPIGLDANGPIFLPEEEPIETEEPVNMAVLNSYTTNPYVSVIDINSGQEIVSNVRGLDYSLNKPKDVTFTYRITNYEQWKGKLSIFSGDDWSLSESNAGDPVMIDENGSFVVHKSADSASPEGVYLHFLKFCTSQRGNLTLSVTAIADGFEWPVYTNEEMSLQFVETANLDWDNWQVEGNVNEKMLFKPVLSNLDPIFEKEDIYLNVYVQGLTLDQYELYSSDGEPIRMEASEFEPEYTFSADRILTWKQGKQINDLILVPKAVPAVKDLYIYANAYFQGFEIPCINCSCGIVIKESNTANEPVEDSSIRITTESGSVTVHLEEGSELTIFTLDGKLIATTSLSAGDHRIPLPKGCYLIQIDGKSYKIIL